MQLSAKALSFTLATKIYDNTKHRRGTEQEGRTDMSPECEACRWKAEKDASELALQDLSAVLFGLFMPGLVMRPRLTV